MAANFYDVALLEKLKKWTSELQNLTILGVNESRRLFQQLGDITNDKPIELPLISLSRVGNMEIQNIAKKPLVFDGHRRKAVSTEEGNKVDQLNAIPITLNYQIDIYTRYLEDAEEYLREFIFNIIMYPKVQIMIPYNNARIKHNCNIRLDPVIEDNSDIPERLIPGQFTRKTIKIYIDDAYLFSYKIKDTLKLEVNGLEIQYNDKVEEIEII